MDNPMPMALHDEFAKRMQEEHDRQNHRIGELEKKYEENNKLLVSVERLASSMEIMQKELRDQSCRIAKIENRDGEMWRKVVGHVATAVIGAVICFIFTQIGM